MQTLPYCPLLLRKHLADVHLLLRNKMSRELRDTYVVRSFPLTVILLASALGALMFSTVLFCIQLAVEGARRRREARASKARRLRYATDDSEVNLPALTAARPPTPRFHVFLSQCAAGPQSPDLGVMGCPRPCRCSHLEVLRSTPASAVPVSSDRLKLKRVVPKAISSPLSCLERRWP